MENYRDDFTYYYYYQGKLKIANKVSDIPEHIEEFTTITEAVSWLQRCGCAGISIHNEQRESIKLGIEVLKIAVYKYGQIFEKVYRGVRSSRPESEYKILYGSDKLEIAKKYGDVVEYKNVRGLLTNSWAKSVISEDIAEMDTEIIFFPN
jgi:hypothetical protein